MAEKKEPTMQVVALVDIIYGGKKHTTKSGPFEVTEALGKKWIDRAKPIAKESK